MQINDDATATVQSLRQLVNDWPYDVAETIRELFTFEDQAVMETLIHVTRMRIGDREYPSVTQAKAIL